MQAPSTGPFLFRDLDTVTDEVHDLFAALRDANALAPALDEFGVEVMKLAVHEWIANLVQHADFSGCPPAIKLNVLPNGRRVHCAIEDNSRGFDFHSQVEEQRETLEQDIQPARGRGLLMLIACTEDLRYGHDDDGWQRLEFWIRGSTIRPWNIPF